jgi:hypothetical protein
LHDFPYEQWHGSLGLKHLNLSLAQQFFMHKYIDIVLGFN